jgi:hypothetical protein
LFFRASYMGKPKKSATRIGNHYFYRWKRKKSAI